MAYRFDSYDNALVIDGFPNGIAPDPFSGLANLQNINLISIPNEGSVNFATIANTPSPIPSGTVTSRVSGTVVNYTGAAGIESGMAIKFTSVGSYTGISTNTPYWVGSLGGGTFSLYTDYPTLSTVVTLGGSGTAVFTVYSPDFSTYQGNQPNKCTAAGNFLVDSKGFVWSSQRLTGTNSYWTFAGNKPNNNGDVSNGNGIVYYQGSNGKGWLFVFNDSSIDYTCTTNAALSWVYNWNPGSGGTGPGVPMLNSGSNSGNSHDSLVGQDNTVYYCDANYLGSFFEKPGQNFDPTSTATYTWAKNALQIPTVDTAQCLAELGTNLMVGGTRNLIYPWNRVATSFTYPIFLAESNVQKMVTVNTNTFIFTGNRGRIYVTNGSQAQLWKKIPDHISGTVEPYYRWGGTATSKNQIYFSVLVSTNGDPSFASPLSGYGGIWAVDMDTTAIRLCNQLSYGTFAGYAPALVAYNSTVGGTGFIAGWNSGASTYGIDGTSIALSSPASRPYTNSSAIIETDLIPIGTYEMPRNLTRLEYRLTTRLVSGESVTVYSRTNFSDAYTVTPILTDSTVGHFSNSAPVDFENAQWIQFKIVLNSTATNPSYVRFRELRVLGLTGQTAMQTQQLGI